MTDDKLADLNPVDDTLQSEEAKLNCENQLLHKQIPINVAPYIHSQYEQPDPRQYQNPFATGYKVPAGRPFQSVLPSPLIIDDLISDTSSDIYSDSALYGVRRNDPLQRSEGEIGMPSDKSSVGEVRT